MIRKIHQGLWLAAGVFFTLTGVIGLLLPVMPQVPFLLAALLCFMRSSRRFNAWMENQPWFIRIRTRLNSRRRL